MKKVIMGTRCTEEPKNCFTGFPDDFYDGAEEPEMPKEILYGCETCPLLSKGGCDFDEIEGHCSILS